MKSSINIDHICNLARIKLSPEEKKYLVPQMIKIIEWVNKLEELKFDISREEVYSPLASSLPLRKDEVQSSLGVDKALANSPEKSRGYVKVPRVIEGK